ncbi:MAG TPA: DNA-binding response regulator, partial [Flavobacteriaceae bacterium]|nr:DNA-binding response regulator [Flavobacteriaceae bacterium]
LIPDLIISDIMMPETNGIELCNTLKTDYKTSHIPIVLLTAKVGDKNEITGLKTGADAYVTKPFNSEKLKVRVSNLLESRKNLQAYYGKHNVLNFHNIQTNTTEEKFLTKLQEAIKENIVQPDFSAEKLSELMQMSRMQLHRKLKAITGQTASEFINSERMKLAVSIMEKSDNTISEVAYLTGFNTPSYFIKCFKKIHHCTPSEYLLNSCK